MFRKSTCWIVLLYGLLLIAIGCSAYVRKHSLISLVTGGCFGLLIVISALALFAKKKTGIYLACIVTLVLVITFGIRYTANHQTMPAILATLSGGMLLFLLAQSVTWKKS